MCLNIIVAKHITMTKEIPFESEYELHKLTELHLEELFGLKLVGSEIQKEDLRFDSLAFDEKTNSFVIIEYKNELNLNVLGQVRDYHTLLLKNKKYYCDRLENSKNIDFDSTRVMIIGPEFTDEQVENSEDLDFPVEFYLITLFETDDDNGYVIYKQINKEFKKKIDINLNSIRLSKESLLKDKSQEIIDLYRDFEKNLLDEFDDLNLKYLVDAVSIKAQNEFICLINVKNSIKIHYYTKKLDDRENKTRDISKITTGGPLSHYELTLTSGNTDYAIDLIKQVYDQKVKK